MRKCTICSWEGISYFEDYLFCDEHWKEISTKIVDIPDEEEKEEIVIDYIACERERGS